MFKIIGISNRHLCKGDYFESIDRATKKDIYALILREKDIGESEYQKIARRVIDICNKNNTICILHNYINVAINLGVKNIHLPLSILRNSDIKDFNIVGASTHSVEEAVEAEKLGAKYITVSHIFKTDCKKGLEPRGIELIEDVKNRVSIPVYALGGINRNNLKLVMDAGADGACIMSSFMDLSF